MLPITAIVLTKNEEAAVADCVRSLMGSVDQVVVVDSSSSDSTVLLAEDAGAEVVQFIWNGRYPKKKQWSLEHAPIRNPWVLFVDADERLSSLLASELRSMLEEAHKSYGAFDIPITYEWAGTPLRHGQRVVKRALLRKDSCHFPEIDDLQAPGGWEVEGHYQPEVRGPIGRTVGTLIHADPDPLSDWFGRHNRYSDWEAYLRRNPRVREQVKKARSRQGQIFERMPCKPLVLFVYNFIVRGGWRDGRAGLDYATALSFYQWQISAKMRESASKSHAKTKQ